MTILPFNVCLLLVGSIFSDTAVPGDPEQIPDLLPAGTNAVTMIDYTRIPDTPWAMKNDIQAGDLIGVPGVTSQLIIGSEFNQHFSEPPSASTLFARFQNLITDESNLMDRFDRDTIGNNVFAWLESRTAVVPADGGWWTILPARSRQQVARWFESQSPAKVQKHAEFLTESIAAADEMQAFVMLAIDLQHSMRRSDLTPVVRQRWPNLQDEQRQSMVDSMMAIEGVRFAFIIADDLTTVVEIQFGDGPEVKQQHEMQLLQFVLQHAGIRVGDIESWDSSRSADSISYRGKTSENFLENILSLTTSDTEIARMLYQLTGAGSGPRYENTSDAIASDETESIDRELAATEAYLTRLRRLLNGLQDRTADSLLESSFWLDRYAFKIQYLDRDGVDETLLQFADKTSEELRAMAEELENAIVAAAEVFENQWKMTPTWRTYNYGVVRVRRGAWYYAGGGAGNEPAFVDRLQANDKVNDAVTNLKLKGIDLVREFNKTGELLAETLGFEFEAWTPGNMK